MNDYEELILIAQDSEADECSTCPYRGEGNCHSQCEEVTEVYNRYLSAERS